MAALQEKKTFEKGAVVKTDSASVGSGIGREEEEEETMAVPHSTLSFKLTTPLSLHH